jgi:3-phenylpropionate/trans-cinnamate dioxygenase ferredoxin reductase component
MPPDQTILIAGASLAGAKAAETLREEGFDGRVVLAGAEPERPYERPPLSKDYLRGESEREKTFVHDESFYEQREIELRTSTPVTAIDRAASEAVLGDGERLRFDKLLITTGAEPRRLSVPGSELGGILYLREIGDSEAIRERLVQGARLVVIGAGWIGAEVAASARERGAEVTMLEQTSVPLERVLGSELGGFYARLHEDHGVELLTETALEAFAGDGRVERVVTSDGRRIECDAVVVGVGVVPRIELASDAGLAIDNGILVDEYLETSAARIFAAGDVANAHHPLFDERVRVEHWANALNQGPAAARNMLGTGDPYERVPYFYSDQYDVGMEYSGHAGPSDRVVIRGDLAAREFIAFWLRGDRVRAGMNVNVSGVTDAIQELVRSGAPVEDDRLADTDVALEEVARAPALAGGAGLKQFLINGLHYPRRLLTGRLLKGDQRPAASLGTGEATVLQLGDDKVAAYRDDEGTLHAVSAVCTHLGCIVEWNGGERTWDCPCHGSRFDHHGEVLKGPAKEALAPEAVPGEPAASGEGSRR